MKINRQYPTGIKGFLSWLQVKNPGLAARVRDRIANPNLAGFGLTGDAVTLSTAVNETGPVKSSWVDKLSTILTSASQGYLTVSQIKAQNRVLDTNLKRAAQGLAPLDVNLPAYQVQGPSVGVGLTSGTQGFLMTAVLIAAGAFVLVKLIKR